MYKLLICNVSNNRIGFGYRYTVILSQDKCCPDTVYLQLHFVEIVNCINICRCPPSNNHLVWHLTPLHCVGFGLSLIIIQ